MDVQASQCDSTVHVQRLFPPLLVLHLWFILQLIHLWSHRPSVSATSVPLGESDYHHTGKCSYLLICMCSRLSWALWVAVLSLLVSKAGSLPPCIYLTWYQKGKDCSPLELSRAYRINHDLSEPTKSIQHSQRESHFGIPGWAWKSCIIPEVWFGNLRLWWFATVP